MTFELLCKIIEENNIPKNVKLLSDSGWECSATDMDGVFYNKVKNELIFTQHGDKYDPYYEKIEWTCIYGKLKDFRDAHGYDYYECYDHDCISNLDYVCFRADRENCEWYKQRKENKSNVR